MFARSVRASARGPAQPDAEGNDHGIGEKIMGLPDLIIILCNLFVENFVHSCSSNKGVYMFNLVALCLAEQLAPEQGHEPFRPIDFGTILPIVVGGSTSPF